MLSLIFTTYNPLPEFEQRMLQIEKFCDFVIVVDNTPGGYSFKMDNEKIRILSDGNNKGLAKALNDGLRLAIELKCEHVILFDQDSEVTGGLIDNLYDSIQLATKIYGNRVAIGPNHIDDQKDRSKVFAPYEVNQWQLQPVTALPTSGMSFSLKEFQKEDFFSEKFFLDFVDFEWCWRLGKKKWQIYRISNLYLFHRLGLGEYKLLGFKFYKPSPYRQYYQVRDTLNIFIMPYAPFYSRFRLLSVVPFKILVYPFIFGDGLERVKWSLLGIRDFFGRIGGIGAGRKKLA